jgi:hypothetical protein
VVRKLEDYDLEDQSRFVEPGLILEVVVLELSYHPFTERAGLEAI